MKSLVMLLAATAAVMALNSDGALSQNACSNEYVGCIDRCVSRPKSMQDRCMETCQANNGMCNEKIYGSRRQMSPAVAAEPQPQGGAADAQARREPVMAAPQVEAPAAREVEAPQQAEAPAPRRAAPQQAPAARQVDAVPSRRPAPDRR
jgi:hypothetical protein